MNNINNGIEAPEEALHLAPIAEEMLEELRELMGGDEGLTELLSDYLRDTANLVSTLCRVVETEGDGARIQVLAHTIKGSSLTIAAQEMGEAALAIENAGHIDDTLAARAALPTLLWEWERLRNFLSAQIPAEY